MSQTTTDHDTIRQWAEGQGGMPAAVKDTEGGDGEMIRLMFPDRAQSDDADLEEIAWDEWFEQFDANDLALVYEEGSSFNKLVSRD